MDPSKVSHEDYLCSFKLYKLPFCVQGCNRVQDLAACFFFYPVQPVVGVLKVSELDRRAAIIVCCIKQSSSSWQSRSSVVISCAPAALDFSEDICLILLAFTQWGWFLSALLLIFKLSQVSVLASDTPSSAHWDNRRTITWASTSSLLSPQPSPLLLDDCASVFISLSVILPPAICQPAQSGSEGMRCHMSSQVRSSVRSCRVLTRKSWHGPGAGGGVADATAEDISEWL